MKNGFLKVIFVLIGFSLNAMESASKTLSESFSFISNPNMIDQAFCAPADFGKLTRIRAQLSQQNSSLDALIAALDTLDLLTEKNCIPALFLRAQIAKALGKQEEYESNIATLIKDKPEYPPLQLLIASQHLAKASGAISVGQHSYEDPLAKELFARLNQRLSIITPETAEKLRQVYYEHERQINAVSSIQTVAAVPAQDNRPAEIVVTTTTAPKEEPIQPDKTQNVLSKEAPKAEPEKMIAVESSQESVKVPAVQAKQPLPAPQEDSVEVLKKMAPTPKTAKALSAKAKPFEGTVKIEMKPENTKSVPKAAPSSSALPVVSPKKTVVSDQPKPAQSSASESIWASVFEDTFGNDFRVIQKFHNIFSKTIAQRHLTDQEIREIFSCGIYKLFEGKMDQAYFLLPYGQLWDYMSKELDEARLNTLNNRFHFCKKQKEIRSWAISEAKRAFSLIVLEKCFVIRRLNEMIQDGRIPYAAIERVGVGGFGEVLLKILLAAKSEYRQDNEQKKQALKFLKSYAGIGLQNIPEMNAFVNLVAYALEVKDSSLIQQIVKHCSNMNDAQAQEFFRAPVHQKLKVALQDPGLQHHKPLYEQFCARYNKKEKAPVPAQPAPAPEPLPRREEQPAPQESKQKASKEEPSVETDFDPKKQSWDRAPSSWADECEEVPAEVSKKKIEKVESEEVVLRKMIWDYALGLSEYDQQLNAFLERCNQRKDTTISFDELSELFSSGLYKKLFLDKELITWHQREAYSYFWTDVAAKFSKQNLKKLNTEYAFTKEQDAHAWALQVKLTTCAQACVYEPRALNVLEKLLEEKTYQFTDIQAGEQKFGDLLYQMVHTEQPHKQQALTLLKKYAGIGSDDIPQMNAFENLLQYALDTEDAAFLTSMVKKLKVGNAQQFAGLVPSPVFERAISRLSEIASDDGTHEYMIAGIYRSGLGGVVKRDEKKAFLLTRKAIERGNFKAAREILQESPTAKEKSEELLKTVLCALKAIISSTHNDLKFEADKNIQALFSVPSQLPLHFAYEVCALLMPYDSLYATKLLKLAEARVKNAVITSLDLSTAQLVVTSGVLDVLKKQAPNNAAAAFWIACILVSRASADINLLEKGDLREPFRQALSYFRRAIREVTHTRDCISEMLACAAYLLKNLWFDIGAEYLLTMQEYGDMRAQAAYCSLILNKNISDKKIDEEQAINMMRQALKSKELKQAEFEVNSSYLCSALLRKLEKCKGTPEGALIRREILELAAGQANLQAIIKQLESSPEYYTPEELKERPLENSEPQPSNDKTMVELDEYNKLERAEQAWKSGDLRGGFELAKILQGSTTEDKWVRG